MRNLPANPFERESDPDRHAIWQMMIIDDSEAFLAADFSRIESDFDSNHFEGIRCGMSGNPANWSIPFPDLPSYRAAWMDGAKKFAELRFHAVTLREALYSRCSLARIDIAGD